MSVFITGTDTECGKTHVSTVLLGALAAQGHAVAGMKPAATGATLIDGVWRNEDVDALLAASTVRRASAQHNPYLYEPPCSPHIAAAESRRAIELGVIEQAYRELAAAADIVVVEGVGGWRVPLGPALDVAVLAKRLALPVVLVVGVRLGCINHALLSAEAIRADGSPFAGWVANELGQALHATEQVVATLVEQMPVPCLARIPWQAAPKPAQLAALCAAAGGR